jgi:hypothetical protein
MLSTRVNRWHCKQCSQNWVERRGPKYLLRHSCLVYTEHSFESGSGGRQQGRVDSATLLVCYCPTVGTGIWISVHGCISQTLDSLFEHRSLIRINITSVITEGIKLYTAKM